MWLYVGRTDIKSSLLLTPIYTLRVYNRIYILSTLIQLPHAFVVSIAILAHGNFLYLQQDNEMTKRHSLVDI